jgi:hypothetical protein
MEKHVARYDDDTPWDEIRDFHASPDFVTDFKQRNGSNSQRGRFTRRPDRAFGRCVAWKRETEELLATVDRNFSFSGDETSWCLYRRAVTTWAPTGANGIVIGTPGNERECLTVMATIRASGKRDPLYILARGKTVRVERT